MFRGRGADSSKLPGMGGIFNHINCNLYAYGANNPVHYIDPDGNDIKESELYSLSVGAGVAGCFSLGIAKDSNHKTAIFVKLESGFGVGGSLGKFDKALKSLDTVTKIVRSKYI